MECDECKRGVHRHMDALKEPGIAECRNSAEWADAIDCKNLVGDGQCVCREWVKVRKDYNLYTAPFLIVDPYAIVRPGIITVSRLPELFDKTLVSNVTVVLDGTNWSIGVIRPRHRDMKLYADEMKAKAAAANIPGNLDEIVRNRVMLEAAKGSFKWSTEFYAMRTMKGQAHTLVPGGGFGLNYDLLLALKKLACQEVIIDFDGIRERVRYVSEVQDWFEHGVRYKNPDPPEDYQAILAKSYMREQRVFGKNAPEVQQEQREKRDWLEQNPRF